MITETTVMLAPSGEISLTLIEDLVVHDLLFTREQARALMEDLRAILKLGES